MRYLPVVLMTIVLAVATAGGLRSARAQSPMAIDFDSALSPDLMRHDLPTIRTILALDAEQATIVESLLRDYSERFEAALRAVREDLRQAQSAMGFEDPAVAVEREQLREEIAILFEEMQEALENVPPGANAGEIATKYERYLKDLQKRLETLQSQPKDQAAFARMFEDASLRLEQWRQEKRTIRERFVADLMLVVHDEQQALWPALDRRLVRERTLARSLLQGEGVDLLLVARDMKPSEAQQQALAQPLSEYEIALDHALRSRNSMIESSERPLFKAVQNNDRASLAAIITRITQARTALRNVNDDAVLVLASALGDDGPRLIAMYHQRAYPQAVRDTQAMRLMKAAQQMRDLSAAQLQAVNDLRVSYEAEIAAINEQVLATIRQHEPALVTYREVMRLLEAVEEEEDEIDARGPDAIQQAFERRNDVSRRYDEQLLAVLGEDLYERLPRNTRAVEPRVNAQNSETGDDGLE